MIEVASNLYILALNTISILRMRDLIVVDAMTLQLNRFANKMHLLLFVACNAQWQRLIQWCFEIYSKIFLVYLFSVEKHSKV